MELVAGAEEAVIAGVLGEDDAGLAFRHDLVREAVYRQIPDQVRTAMHRGAASVVADGGGSVVLTAEHVRRGGDTGSESVRVLVEAARAMADRAPHTAADLYIRALAMMVSGDPARSQVSAEAIGPLVLACRLAEARTYADDALRGGLMPEQQASVLLWLAQGLKRAGRNPDAIEYAQRALQLSELDDVARARLYGILAYAAAVADDTTVADSAGTRARQLGEASGDLSAAVAGHTARSEVAQIEGRLDDALTEATAAVALADPNGSMVGERQPRIWLGAAHTSLDHFDEADAEFVQAQQEAERYGVGWAQPTLHFERARLTLAQGRLDDAAAEARTGLAAAEREMPTQMSVHLRGLLAGIAVLQREVPLAQAHLRQVRRLLDAGITAPPELVAWPAALLYHARGNRDAALNELAHVYHNMRCPGFVGG